MNENISKVLGVLSMTPCNFHTNATKNTEVHLIKSQYLSQYNKTLGRMLSTQQDKDD